ncbi:FecR family protein [Mucilaginibacter paludis]|uniref:Anti-FecI sigma factor, FecR n=1 Tax=Mucilaginibacter paludis DSM 18603 TaxID=714943 RepID=H1YF56_9SPHI|nr:FecR family protein [Mucilaginibacter paludis]EHQ26195.1 anti-FecI sigma factor, FecR [Mucilaginibacter paludis DSM 18603]
MAENESNIAYLFKKLADGTASKEELAAYFELTKDNSLDDKITALMQAELKNNATPEIQDTERIDRVYNNIEAAIRVQQPAIKKSNYPFFKRWAAAAAILIVAGGLFYYSQNKPSKNNTQLVANDVAPGHQGATLTLANGKKIILTQAINGKLAKEAGVTITKTANGQLVYQVEGTTEVNKVNTLSTDNGETYKVQLPDGSEVWLNSASSLTYNTNLNENGKRMVSLTGEAYFQVAKDKAHPFIVHTEKQDVEVLGTHFNINSYKDEPAIATTLLEGSVKVTSGTYKQIIKPGEQAVNNGAGIKVAVVDADNITDWKDGDFNLNHVDFRVAMRKVARWYDVEVVYDKSVPEDIETGGWISRKQKLSAVLKFIESSGLVHFKVEGKKIYISK